MDKEELIAYQIRLTEHNTNQQTNRVFQKEDENQDGVVSFDEVWIHSEEGSLLPLFGFITIMWLSCDPL